jgi:hypothetical protein
MKKTGVVDFVQKRMDKRALGPDMVKALGDAIEQGWRGNVVAIGLCFAYRDKDGITRWQGFECDEGQHIYLLGLCQRLAAAAEKKSLSISE